MSINRLIILIAATILITYSCSKPKSIVKILIEINDCKEDIELDNYFNKLGYKWVGKNSENEMVYYSKLNPETNLDILDTLDKYKISGEVAGSKTISFLTFNVEKYLGAIEDAKSQGYKISKSGELYEFFKSTNTTIFSKGTTSLYFTKNDSFSNAIEYEVLLISN